MHGAITLCTIHNAVWNTSKREWQVVSEEMIVELKEMAQEVGSVNVFEGCCPSCHELASASLSALYGSRYADAMYKELGNIIVPKDASEA